MNILRLKNKDVSAEELRIFNLRLTYVKQSLEGDTKGGSVMVGQVAGMLSQVQTVSEIIEDIYQSCVN